MARIVKVDNISYLYIYTKSGVNCGDFSDACDAGYGDFDPEADITDSTEIPMFTVSPMGRGESALFFRINPEYTSTRSKSTSDYTKYSFEVLEDSEEIESTIVTMNPEIIVDGVAQAINPKIKSNSSQIKVKLYEDGIYKLVGALAETAVDTNGDPIPAATLINMDFINGYDRKGVNAIGGIVTIAQTTGEGDDQWTANKPDDIELPYDLADSVGIPLVNGSYGTMGASPITNTAEYKKCCLLALAKIQILHYSILLFMTLMHIRLIVFLTVDMIQKLKMLLLIL
jgi:hypothetical protein